MADWEGETHTLIVHSVTLPDGPLDDGDLDYDIEHAASCKRTEETTSDGHGVVCWQCEVQTQGVDDGLAFSLRYSGTPVTEPGTYKIRGWGRKYWTECGDEYDGGVVVVDDADQSGLGADRPAERLHPEMPARLPSVQERAREDVRQMRQAAFGHDPH